MFKDRVTDFIIAVINLTFGIDKVE